MNLSPRAQTYLGTLHRGDVVPVDRVAEALREAGAPVLDVWLDFHARYAGYEEGLGKETAVWGIVHADSYWMDPMTADVEQRGSSWKALCAECHPSFDYKLYANGEFHACGVIAETFEHKLERDALVHEATCDGRTWEFGYDLMNKARTLERIRGLSDLVVIPEASDKFMTAYRSRDLVVIAVNDPSPGWQAANVWVAAEALEGFLRELRRTR